MPGHVQRHALALGQAALGGAAQIEFHGAGHAVDPFRVPVRMGLAEQLAAFAEAA
jgi:hypothetical protein